MKQKTIALFVVATLIVASIYYLESQKAATAPEISGTDEMPPLTVSAAEMPEAEATDSILPETMYSPDSKIISEKAKQYPAAPELTGITGFVNTPEFTLSQLRGKVVLVDFWTYSCINCIRTQPYLNAWYETYNDNGLVIVGVHAPEFEFEKSTENVLAAIEKAGIEYPVVQDNNKATWSAYGNRFWPRKYLIDIDGFIRYDHIGEGAYSETEEVIKGLLKERSQRFGIEADMNKESSPVNAAYVDFSKVLTPEIYFGYAFDRSTLGNPEGFKPEQVNDYAAPGSIEASKAYLSGQWINKADYSEVAGEEGKVTLHYSAMNVNMVASSETHADVEIILDGKKLNRSNAGVDGTVISSEKLYNIVSSPEYGWHTLEINAPKGLRIYTFTFG